MSFTAKGSRKSVKFVSVVSLCEYQMVCFIDTA